MNRTLTRGLQERLSVNDRQIQKYEAGAVLIAAGQRVARLPQILRGSIEAVVYLHRGNGLQVVPIQFHQGETVMLSYLFSKQPSTADMVATETTEVRWVDTDEVELVMQSEPLLAVQLIQFLSQRLREVQDRERSWMERSVPLRVAAALARMTSDRESMHDRWELRVTHDQIANRAGVSRPKASLAMKQLEREGFIRLGRGVVHIVDITALQAKANSAALEKSAS